MGLRCGCCGWTTTTSHGWGCHGDLVPDVTDLLNLLHLVFTDVTFLFLNLNEEVQCGLVHKSFIKHEYLYLPQIFTFVSSSTLSDSMMEIFLVCSLRLAWRLSFSLLSLANSSLKSKSRTAWSLMDIFLFFSFAFDFREAILNFRFGAM